jgi:hypothetical protein
MKVVRSVTPGTVGAVCELNLQCARDVSRRIQHRSVDVL